ncbi:GAF domain-containing hybrid sensor histidine kinase/response regulator [uncultured Psychrosphaera sp.]|uniref:GAF domain-containing hybrid sensor histidine kinase/response regulator n=1 Tax=uncultured Psychrosphaera sp. TaxID=1403522 RepID=UPI0026372F3F|nr:GAF domain-containing hybrid sensor histidine kinase/response regulator [uncultured Psychrosphaera sp.]
MKSATKPIDENERLKALFEYEILDTESEKAFDDLTLLASEICETPISLISLVDPDRQWFKSKVGVDVDSTDRDIAFCSHAILQDDLFEVQNALKDERFFDNPLVTSDPNIRFYAGTPLVSPSGQKIGTLCVISDKPKKLTSSQKKALTILGREVISQLELRMNNKKLEIANNYKTEFLSNASHEIRTPLNAIIGLSGLILENKELKEKFAEQYDFIEQIDFSGKQLLNIINSILDLSKIEAGKMELEPVECHLLQYINNIFISLSGKAKAKLINYSKEYNFSQSEPAPELVIIDEPKLGQVLTNILGNAIKFTPANKSIKLTVSVNRNMLSITVTDEGVGISPEEQALLFNKYTQVGSNKTEGTGLGLSITKGLIDLMGGSINLKSELGKGTSVSFELPFEIPDVTSAMKKETSQLDLATLSKLSILVVEDNKVNQMVIIAMLKSLKVTANIVGSGEEALDDLKTHQYDVILMDINLPGIDGVETTQNIKALNIKSYILALTADVYRTSEDKKLFNNFLTKPILLDDLKDALLQAVAEISGNS